MSSIRAQVVSKRARTNLIKARWSVTKQFPTWFTSEIQPKQLCATWLTYNSKQSYFLSYYVFEDILLQNKSYLKIETKGFFSSIFTKKLLLNSATCLHITRDSLNINFLINSIPYSVLSLSCAQQAVFLFFDLIYPI